jgi:hypothetical protein
MKKKIFFIILLISGIISAFNINMIENESGDISLQNIEMLSFGETGDNYECYLTGILDCPKNSSKVLYV